MTHPQSYKQPESILVVVHTRDHRILLLERVNPPGFWQSVTGSIEPGETPLQAAVREIEEETGIAARAHQLRDWHRSYRFEIHPEWRSRFAPEITHNTEHVFSLHVPATVEVRTAPTEHVRHAWLPREQAAARAFSWTNREVILDL